MSKAGLASIAEGRRDVLKIDPRKLSVRANWNSRDFNDPANLDHIESLASSIAEKGVITPIRANWEDGKAYIVNGECRYRACMLLIERGVDVKTVPVIGDDQFANDVDRLFTQYLENTGKPFTDLERARHFKRLIDLGWQQEDIAKRSGKTQGWVSQTLALLTAPVAVQKMITQGEVSPTLAMQVVRDEGSAAETVLKNGLAKSGTGKVTPASVGRQNIKTLICQALDASDINDDSEDCIVLKMPPEQWEALKAALKY